jgi:poly(A) polymerase
MEEDAGRRDFTINALYYCPIDHHLIDYVEAFPDLRARRLRTLVRAEASFAEDPVRMIRAVKYSALLGFPFPISLAGLVRRMRESILSCSRERVTEEVFKILTSGSAADILELAHRLRLFEVIFPAHSKYLKESRTRLSESPLGIRLKELDGRTAAGDLLDRSQMFGFLFIDLAMGRKDILEDPDPDFLLQQFVRTASDPLFPSKKDLAVAAQSILNTVRPSRRARSPHPAPGQRAPASAHGPRNPASAPKPASGGAKPASAGAVKRRHRRGRGRGRRGGAGKGPAPAGPAA